MKTLRKLHLALRRLYFKIVPHYRRIELRFVPYGRANYLLSSSVGRPERSQWRLAKEEDYNRHIGLVALERRERIVE